MNNKIINKKLIIYLLTFLLCLIEVFMIFMILKSVLTKDLISPEDVKFYEYLKVKLSNLI